MSKISLSLSILALGLACVVAGPVAGAERRLASVDGMTEQGATLAPTGFVVFCASHPHECESPSSLVDRVDLTPERAAELHLVNAAVNRAIRYTSDQGTGLAKDRWTLAPSAGDCEDYAVTKRHALIARGWAPSVLRLAVAYTAEGVGHAVLVAKTHAGDLVLDNRSDRIEPWRRTNLRWVAIQSADNPRYWNKL